MTWLFYPLPSFHRRISMFPLCPFISPNCITGCEMSCSRLGAEIAFFCNLPCQPTERSEARRGSARLSLIGGARAAPIKLNRLISQPDRADGLRPSELQLAARPIGELTSATVLLRNKPGFYEKPRFSRRLVKRLVVQPASPIRHTQDGPSVEGWVYRVWLPFRSTPR